VRHASEFLLSCQAGMWSWEESDFIIRLRKSNWNIFTSHS